MSLADTAADHMDDWVGKALDAARQGLDRLAPRLAPGPTTLAHEAAVAALDALEDHKADLAALGKVGSAYLLSSFGVGEPAERTLEWLRKSASFEERLAAQRVATGALLDALAAREAAWESLLATLEDVGRAAVRYLAPVLTAALLAAI